MESTMKPLAIYDPGDLESSEPPPLEQFGYRFLVEGDSSLTIGSLNPAKNSNLLYELAFRKSACAVSCAYPGDTLQHMVKMAKGRAFRELLMGRRARYWDGILLSAGGNDLIEAASARGAGLAPKQRLLLKPDEWGPPSAGASRYVSSDGWQTFSDYFRANLLRFIEMRDAGPSRGVPLFMHGYAVPTPRPAGAGLGFGPWLYPSLVAYTIPREDFIPLAQELIRRLAELIGDCARDGSAYPNLHFFDSTQIAIRPAAPDSRDEDGDWVNEIHLTWKGYEKIARPWAKHIEKILG